MAASQEERYHGEQMPAQSVVPELLGNDIKASKLDEDKSHTDKNTVSELDGRNLFELESCGTYEADLVERKT